MIPPKYGFLITLLLLVGPLHAETLNVSKVDVDRGRDRLAKALHVNQLSVTFTAATPYRYAAVRIDFFRNAKKVESLTTAAVMNSHPQDKGTLSVQIIDLDYLRLGNSPKASLRFVSEIETHGEGPPVFCRSEKDVAKSKCDISSINGASSFPDRAPFDGAVPLFWMLSTHDSSTRAGRSPSNLLQINPSSDIVIVSLVLKADDDPESFTTQTP